MNFLDTLKQFLCDFFYPPVEPVTPPEPTPTPTPDPNDIFVNPPAPIVVAPMDLSRPNLPARSSYLTGSQFAAANDDKVPIVTRDANVLKEILAGNFPDFLRQFVPVTASIGDSVITLYTMPDYLSVGTDENFLRLTMSAPTAQLIAEKFDCSLPTPKMVKEVWDAAKYKLDPQPNGAPYDQTMDYTSSLVHSNDKINKQMTNKGIKAGSFVSGIKKDVVLTNELAPNNPNKRVAIFGWYYANGKPIQQLQAQAHQLDYQDYSQAFRLVSNNVTVNSRSMRLQDVFSDPILCKLVSDEGPLKFLSY